MSWINLVRVCLDVFKGCLLHIDQEHVYQQLLVPEHPLHPTKVAVYSNKEMLAPPGGLAELRASPVD